MRIRGKPAYIIRHYIYLFKALTIKNVTLRKKKIQMRKNDARHKHKILWLHNDKCDLCDSKKQLQIHHRKYIPNHTRRKFISILCNRCHIKYHQGKLSLFERLKYHLLLFKIWNLKGKFL